MKSMRWQKIFIVAIFIVVFVIVLATNERPVSYSDFLSRDQQEIGVIADACDKFLRAMPRDAIKIRVLSGNDKSLPPILRELRATQVEVASGFREGTNTVSRLRMTIGKPQGQFTVAWENSVKDNSLWELVVTGGQGQRIVILSLRKKSAPTEGRR